MCDVVAIGVFIVVGGFIGVVFSYFCDLYVFCRYYCSIVFCSSLTGICGICLAYGGLWAGVFDVRSLSISLAFASSTYLSRMAS
jgi:hypothetical protein